MEGRTPLSVLVTSPRIVISGHVSEYQELSGLGLSIDDARKLNKELSGALKAHDKLYAGVTAGHYTSKPWHVIPTGDGRLHIKCDTSYATAGVMEYVFTPDPSKLEFKPPTRNRRRWEW